MTWAITGTGLVSSLGGDVASSFQAYLSGDTSLHPLRVFDTSKYRVQVAYEMDDRPGEGGDVPGRAGHWLVGAIREALVRAGLDDRAKRADLRIPVLVGTGLAEQRSLELWRTAGAELGLDDLHFAGVVARETGLRHTLTIVNACAASLYALAVGTDLLALGEADAVVVAGTDALSETMFGLLDRVNMNPPEQVRPFDADRQGVILGEGAAAVVIEPVARARARGATRLATLRGVGTSCDAHHVTAPLREGVRRAFREAHRRAGVTPDEIDVVMAHGTGTLLNDLTEAQVLGDVFADAARRPVVTALKSLIGHTSGPSGLMSLVTAIEALHAGKVPPTRNHASPIDEISDFQVVTGQACQRPLRTAQVNAFGFGGVNAVSVLDRESEPTREPAVAGSARTGREVAVTGVGVEIPGVASLPALLALAEADAALPDAEFDPAAVLGRRGLRYKDRATLLGLCAAHKALAAAGLSALPDGAGESFGVVVATELALVETVCRVVETIHTGGVRETSPMDLPNASGNVAAAQIAIWYGLGGLSLTVSSGPTSGLDALHHAAAAIRAGRSDRILVVGVEPGDQQSLRLLRDTARRHGEDPQRLRAFDGACAVVLEAGDLVRSRGVTPLGWVGDYVRHTWVDDAPDTTGLWALPCLGHNGAEREADAAVRLRDMKPGHVLSLSPTIGEASAAYGVLQYAAAATRVADGAPEAVVSAGGCWRGEFASLRLRRDPLEDPSDDPSGAPA